MRCGEEKGCRGNVTGKWGSVNVHIIPAHNQCLPQICNASILSKHNAMMPSKDVYEVMLDARQVHFGIIKLRGNRST